MPDAQPVVPPPTVVAPEEGAVKIKKSNNPMLIASFGILVLVLLGGIVIVKNLNKKVTPAPVAEVSQQTDLPPVDASVTVDLKPRADGKAVTLSVSKIPSGTNSIEYELSYTTDKGLPKGALGKIQLDGKSEISREVLLGTCSKNVCTYDTGVTAIKLVLRFNADSGSSQFSKEYSL